MQKVFNNAKGNYDEFLYYDWFMLGCSPSGGKDEGTVKGAWWFHNWNLIETMRGLKKQWSRFCLAWFTVQWGTVVHINVMCGLSLESWAVCHVGRSCETGAEMKRLAGGEVGCAFSMAVLTGLWYFSKECECICVYQKNLLTFLLGLCRCLWLEACLYAIVLLCMLPKSACYCVYSCVRHVLGDRRESLQVLGIFLM